MTTSSLDPHLDEIRGYVADGLTFTDIALLLTRKGVSTSRHSVKRLVEKHGIEKPQGADTPGFEFSEDDGVVVSKPYSEPITAEQLCDMYCVDMDLWEISTQRINAYGYGGDDGKVPLFQTRVNLKRKKPPIEMVLPARADAPYIAPPRLVTRKKSKMILSYGDQQCKWINWDMFEAVLSLTREHQPDMIIDPGDGRDFPSLSTHKTWEAWKASAQECLDAKYTADREMRRNNEAAEIVQFLGNHDIRLANYMQEKASEAYGITPGCAPDEERMQEVMSIRNLGRLDELNIELVTDEKQAYDQARFFMSPEAAVEHGNRTGKDPALKAGSRLRFSLCIGHTHGHSLNWTTEYDEENVAHVNYYIENGTGCLIERGLGYTPNPDWVNGGWMFSLHEDGTCHPEPIVFRQGRLYFRDRVY